MTRAGSGVGQRSAGEDGPHVDADGGGGASVDREPSGAPPPAPDPFWDRPDIVERFADRDPDHRLRRLMDDVEDPSAFRVLDLGCAAGRNTVYLAERGVDVHAVDASEAMLTRTRDRLGDVVGPEEAERRVRWALMTDLGAYDDASFELVIALGVLHTAVSVEEWNVAISEIARVIRPGGRVLVSNFSPGSRPEGERLPRVDGSPHARRWRDDRPMILMDAEEHDASFESHGFTPVEETETVHVPLEDGFRITVNAMYEWSA